MKDKSCIFHDPCGRPECPKEQVECFYPKSAGRIIEEEDEKARLQQDCENTKIHVSYRSNVNYMI